MRVLHYALGFPPYRTGGMTKFCMDLMITQMEQGNEVALLWPGRMNLLDRKIYIHKSSYKGCKELVSFEIINPLPIPLDEGIIKIKKFTEKGDTEFYHDFLKKYEPSVIHIHTLMGLHKELIKAAKKLNIRTVFTTHDYFGLCSKVTLFYNGHTCDNLDCADCIACNQSALSIKKIILMQSPIYRIFKNTALVKTVREKHRNTFFEDDADNIQIMKNKIRNNEKIHQYQRLRQHYVEILSWIDVIHFNSTVSEKIYKRYFVPKVSRVISITHRGITDHRKIKNYSDSKLKITYLASAKPFKGFNILIKALDKIWVGNKNIELNSYSNSDVERQYLHTYNGFSQSELNEIFDRTDLLIAPSIWYETFGFTVLEALSYGVPVIVSENVGAKDIIGNAGITVPPNDEEALYNVLLHIIKDKKILQKMNQAACSVKLPEIKQMAADLEECYNNENSFRKK